MDITSIRYINMEKSWQRKLFMRLLLRRLPYKIFRSPGVQFDAENKTYDKYLKMGIHPYLNAPGQIDRKNGAVGCWIAHSQVLEQVTEKTGITVVLEDDFVCNSMFFKKALDMINAFNRDFDIILFDAWGTGPLEIDRLSEKIYRPGFYGFPYYGGTHCLFVNNAKIQKILDKKLHVQVVDFDGFLFQSGMIETYIFYTGECATRDIGSDISHTYKLKYDILGMCMGLLPPVWREGTKRFKSNFWMFKERKILQFSDEKLLSFEGYYQSQQQNNVNIRFTRKDGKLALIRPWESNEILLEPISDVDFISRETSINVTFESTNEGEIRMVLIDKVYSYEKNDNHQSVDRSKVILPYDALKILEGRYCFEVDKNYIIEIFANEDEILVKQLWDQVEIHFFAQSELEFFAKHNSSFSLKFVKNGEGDVVKVEAFDENILIKIT